MAEPTPPQQEHLKRVLGWCQEAIAEAENMLRSEYAYDKFSTIRDKIMGDYSSETAPSSLSQIYYNHFGKVATDLAAALTDIKPFWEYRTFNKKFDQQAQILQKCAHSWWIGRMMTDMKFCDCIKYGEMGGSGYAHLTWNEIAADLELIPEDPRDVLPVRPASYLSVQDCMGVIIRRERSLNYLKQKYPHVASLLKADRDSSFTSRAQVKAQQLMSKMGMSSGFMDNLWASLGGRPQNQMQIPSADLFTLHVKDDRRNESSRPVWIGEGDPNGNHPNWSYWAQPGELLYPRGRTIIFTRTVLLRDGPNIFWHGLFPLCKLTLSPWPGSWLGKPLLLDLLPLQMELNRLLRGVSDHNQKVFRPDLLADKNSVSRAALQSIDTRKAGLHLRANSMGGQGIQIPPVPPLDPSIEKTVQFLIDGMDKLGGVRDLSQMMNLGQIPSAETVDKIMESMSPTVRLYSRTMEAFLREFALMTMSNFFQFYDMPRRLAILGDDGITFEDFDYDPNTLLPDFVNDDDARSNVVRPRYERAKDFLRNFTYHVAPGSLLSASEVTTKLLYIQLSRAGMLDIWTLLDKLGIPNVGSPPPGTNTIPERLAKQAEMGIGMSVSPTGRKASGQEMPHMKQGRIAESS